MYDFWAERRVVVTGGRGFLARLNSTNITAKLRLLPTRTESRDHRLG